jgi:hypothetical protein
MRRYVQESKVKNYARLGRILGYGGLGVMGLGFVLSLRQPYDVSQVFTTFLLGMLASQVGLPLVNRWGRHPRVDEVLDAALRGLDSRFGLFHYCLGADHALITPGGVFALIPRVEPGLIEYGEGGWQRTPRRRGGSMGKPRRMRGLDRAAEVDVSALQRKLGKLLGDSSLPPVGAVLVFLHSSAELVDGGSPVPAAHVKKLKPLLRKLPKAPTLHEQDMDRLAGRLGLTSDVQPDPARSAKKS